MRRGVKIYGMVSVLSWLLACHSPDEKTTEANQSLFTLLPSSVTGIEFINALEYDEEFNVYTYRNFYNGGGVGLGDINNDGLLDIYFCGNQKDNKLYLNKGPRGDGPRGHGRQEGSFKFEDITEKAGVSSKGVWSTGVSMADVNGDGLLDIYVCKSGDLQGENRHNELFINNGDLTFTEKANEYGIADIGLSTHAAFFDYDKDGDLDLYLLNNSFRSVGGYDIRKGLREIRDPMGGNKLYRNDGERFTDVSEEAEIYGSAIGFGLGVTVGDVNKDGWQDIFVSNDFFERDYLYLNQQAGPDGKVTFKECLEEFMNSTSLGSMGADMADLNNDGYPEIFVTEMLPEDDARLKTKAAFENWDKYQKNVDNGYFHQFPRNVLQLNNGNNTFSEIGRLAGVHATDWSWGALITDLDNDGYKDIYVANGIYKDLIDQDYIQFMGDPNTVRAILTRENAVIKRLVDSIPSEKLPNYAFANQGDLTFRNEAKHWGLSIPSHSNGSAYGDLDNDGDLDLVVNNVNMPPFIYRNETDSLLSNHHYLKFELKGEGKNTFAIGTQLTLWYQGKSFYLEQMPMRGFQSSVDPRPNFGVGDIAKVDSVIVSWPDGKITKLKDVTSNQILTLYQKEGQSTEKKEVLNQQTKVLFEDVTARLGIDFRHEESDFVDFDRDRLLFHMHSQAGPCLVKADVNGDGLDDFYVGGARGQSGALYLQNTNGRFTLSKQPAFAADSNSEDAAALFFDADGDGDQDLYVGSGSSEFSSSSTSLLDRLYLNDGKGGFSKSSQLLPTYRSEYTSTVAAADYDGDGDQDLFVGIRMQPFLYGVPVSSYILENDGKGNFTDVTEQIGPSLREIGMVTDGIWTDLDGDGDEDLMVVGDWMSVRTLINESGKLIDKTVASGLEKSHGWWTRIEAADLDHDGDMDFIVGNHGLNSRFKASEEQPLSMWVNDFDSNGTAEQIISVYQGAESYPLVLRHDLLMQMPGLKKKYLKYENYKNQRIEDIFTQEQLQNAIKLEAYTLKSCMLINEGGGKFNIKALPVEAQFSPVYGIMVGDFDGDGNLDILLAGNQYGVKPEVGRYDASYGLLLKGEGNAEFMAVSAAESGLRIKGQVREMLTLQAQERKLFLIAQNDDLLKVVQTKKND